MAWIINKERTSFLLAISTREQLNTFLESESQKSRPALAMLGRSNVGKSSLINALFGKKTARVSKTPGRTREVIIFEITFRNQETKEEKTGVLFDLPGYGHADVSKEMKKQWGALMESFLSQIPEHTLLFTIQDARHPFLEADLVFENYVKSFDLDRLLIFTKLDKLKTQSEKAQLKKMIGTVREEYYTVSSETREGLQVLTKRLGDHFA